MEKGKLFIHDSSGPEFVGLPSEMAIMTKEKMKKIVEAMGEIDWDAIARPSGTSASGALTMDASMPAIPTRYEQEKEEMHQRIRREIYGNTFDNLKK